MNLPEILSILDSFSAVVVIGALILLLLFALIS
jgi:hypothetical protein